MSVVTIPISVAGSTGLTSFQFDLAFSPSIVTALSFSDTGTDSMSAISGAGLTGSGGLADIDFEALSPGTSPLTLSNAFLTDGGVPLSSAHGDFLLQNDQIVVNVAVPEPSTVSVLMVAPGVIGLLRRPGFTGARQKIVDFGADRNDDQCGAR